MATISAQQLFDAIKDIDLRDLEVQGKTIFINGNECLPKYLMYLVEHITGMPYSEYKQQTKKKDEVINYGKH